MNELIQDTKLLQLSTRSSAGRLLNGTKRSLIQYDIPAFLVVDDSIDYIQFNIASAVIPVSFYNINDNNNTLVIIENGITSNYIFPNGNYNANLFISTFKTLLPSRWDITLNSTTSIFTITNSTFPTFSILGSTTMDYILGFSGNITSTNNSLVMPRVCNFLSLPRINIRCSCLANSVLATDSKSTVQNDIVLSVSNNSFPNGQIVFENNGKIKSVFRCDRLDTFLLSITDDDGNLIDFNGVSCFFTFQFDIFRKYLDKPEKFSKIVEMVNSKTL
jgi:hypothetical protein